VQVFFVSKNIKKKRGGRPKNIPLQIEKENFYFMKYNPILNTMTSGRYNPKKSLNKDQLSENKTNNKLELKNKHSRRAKLL
jgi:hypothetical protein